ncbi:uncharacterized protein UTRI_05364_B [Ustilago trichophora]|uniref:Uncharacterized protein n=1 Tax=Ustilago trichophora TaxID=86804 RepID=A0A5C3ELL8_9BASI|nr:uncharacterized protein UTRI_05364_B [Ustilago trichophora]
MSGAVPASRFTQPLPPTRLNVFLRQTKSLLASGGLDNEDAVYVVTPSTPSLDQCVAAISLAYLQQAFDDSVHTQRRYIPVISATRKAFLEGQGGGEGAELALALQTALVAEENVVFEDDEVYKGVNAYTSRKRVVVVGGTGELKGEEGWNEWMDLHGAELFGVVDVENTLPKQIHDEQGGVNQRLHVALFPPHAIRGSGEAEPALASLVAMWAKDKLAEKSSNVGDDKVMARELADLLLAAILLESDNLSESKTNSVDLGAVGWLNPRSSFQLQHQDQATSAEDLDDDVNDDEANAPNYDAFVPTFPDLDAMYRALRSVSRHSNNVTVTKGGVAPPTAAATVDLADASPEHFQWNLITNTLANLDEHKKRQVPDFVHKTIHGDFASVLTSKLAAQLLMPFGTQLGQTVCNAGAFDLTTLQKQLNAAVQSAVTTEGQAYDALCVAICALHAFVQINWTGPELPDSLVPLSLLRSSAPDAFPPRPIDDVDAEDKAERDTSKLIHRASLEALAFKGEPAYHLCQVPFFLCFAKLLIEALWSVQAQTHQIETLAWWRLRAFTVHSHVLDEPVAFGKKVFDPVNKLRDVLVARAAATRLEPEEGEKGRWAGLSSRLILERGIALQRLGSDREASETFVDAAKENGLRYRMSGALGKRTKFQKEDKTQLVLLAKSVVVDGGKEDEEAEKEKEKEEVGSGDKQEDEVEQLEKEEPLETGFASKANPEDQVAGMPSTFALNDDTLLEQTKFTSTTAGPCTSATGASIDADEDLFRLNPNTQPALAVLDQCTLLALCLNIRNTQAAHGLTANQMQIFISRVISHPRNWMVHTMSLLLRARLESTRTRTVERSVLQLQALIDQMPTNDSSIQERLKFFHALDLPPKWEMQAELARRYASIGVTRSALEIFERVEMWEEVVQCLGMLGRQEEGVEVVRELLEGKKVEADVDVSVRRRATVAGDAQGRGESEAQQVMYTRMDRAREAKLWCLLGDLEPDSALSHYTKAWSVSAGSSARAARSLAGVHFTQQEFSQAAKWLKYALRINPLYTRSWFILGCCYMRLEKWKEAAQCFRRCTALDDEDMESWNNLASCYLRMVEGASGSAASDAVGIERMGAQGGLPDILEAEEEADRVWDSQANEYDDEEDQEAGLSDWSGSSRSDSGVEVSSSESEAGSDISVTTVTETGLPDPGQLGNTTTTRNNRNTASATTAYSLKLLAHRSLQQSLRFAHDNWRIWFNYMIVCIDVGYLLEATRAMVRVTEIQTRNKSSDAEKARTVDLGVLARVVDAVTRKSKAELESEMLEKYERYESEKRQYEDEGGGVGKAPLAPKVEQNSGLGLYPAVRRLFDETLLTRISTSAAIWKLYARLLLWNGEKKRAVQTALLNGYNSAFQAALNNNDGGQGDLNSDKATFITLLHDLRNLVDALLDLGEEGKVEGEPEVKFQARSLVRTFLAKTRTSWEDQDEYDEAKELLEQLKS